MVSALFTETRLKLPVTHVTSPPPFAAKTRPVRKPENAAKLVRRKNSFRNAKKSSD